MMRNRYWLLMLAVLLGAPGCGGDGAGDGEDPLDASRREARTLPIPQGGELPPGHPPTAASAPAALNWTAPSHWIEQPPDNPVRLAQYRVPGADGDGECVVFYFGSGQGGGAMANAQRWAGQFAQPGGGSSLDVLQVTELSGAGPRGHLVEVTGTYDGGMSADEELSGAMLLGAIVEGPDAPWFFKFVGPEATVRAERAAFLALIASIDGDG
jgi:hypothetical protein